MSYSPQVYKFGDIAASIRTRCVDKLGLDGSYVRVVASDDYELPVIDSKYVLIRPYGPTPFGDAGAGRRARPMRRLIRFYLYVRSNTDEAGSDLLALTDATDGLFALEDNLADKLDDWFPLNTNGSTRLTIEPLHPVNPGDGPPERKPENEIGIVRSSLLYEVVYLAYTNIVVP